MVFLLYSQHQPRVRLCSGIFSLSPRSVRLTLSLLFLNPAVLCPGQLRQPPTFPSQEREMHRNYLQEQRAYSWMPEHLCSTAQGAALQPGSWCLNSMTWDHLGQDKPHPGSLRCYPNAPETTFNYILTCSEDTINNGFHFCQKHGRSLFAIFLLAFLKCVLSRQSIPPCVYI